MRRHDSPIDRGRDDDRDRRTPTRDGDDAVPAHGNERSRWRLDDDGDDEHRTPMLGYGGIERGYYDEPHRATATSLRGKGPKNYTRSDERIREDVCERLADAALDASDIDVKVTDGEVLLEGTVPDRWTERAAQDVVCRVRGVKSCHNQLRVEGRRS
jgi:hypothetical protein